MKTPSTLAKKKFVISALEDIKAHDIQAIDVRKLTSLFDWIIVASADSARQTKSLARHVRDSLREAGSAIVGTEGEDGGEWVLVDAGDVVAHVMQPAVRQYFNLEELWGDGRFDKVVNPTVPPSSQSPRKADPERKPRAKTSAPKPRAKTPARKPRAKTPVRKPRAKSPARRPRAT